MDAGVAWPVAGVDYPGTYQEFRDWFPDEAACLAYLERLRWPDGFVCPACGGDRVWRTAKSQFMCAACGRKTSVTAGTIFHRSHSPLSTWFAAAWFVTSQNNGVSALGLQGALGFGSYETAWAWLHKLRRAMVRPDRERLDGVVEIDETFVGGRSAGKPGVSTDKVPVKVAVERLGPHRFGRVRLAVADAPATLQLVAFAASVVEPGSTIRTDGARMLRRLGDMGTPTSTSTATPRRTSAGSCPASTWSPRCSSAGSPAPCTTTSAASTCRTTWTSTRSASTAGLPPLGGCCSTGSSSRLWPPAPTHWTS
ncbi:hypothetical protein GCM10009839_93910 [Catenulispora yoronensis]|uniref:ISXO2-like transposase domain-containing protein n=1 Tax=Catenulispora yoronensis TaxID=450799 RepID=A0ABN2VNI6_9ACTN